MSQVPPNNPDFEHLDFFITEKNNIDSKISILQKAISEDNDSLVSETWDEIKKYFPKETSPEDVEGTVVVYDTETTGLRSSLKDAQKYHQKYQDRLTEFAGIAMLKTKNGYFPLVLPDNSADPVFFHTYVNPFKSPLENFPKDVSMVIKNLTNITSAFLAGKSSSHDGSFKLSEAAPEYKDIAVKISNFIGDSELVAHNIAFDNGFIEAENKLCDMEGVIDPYFHNDSHDSMHDFMHFGREGGSKKSWLKSIGMDPKYSLDNFYIFVSRFEIIMNHEDIIAGNSDFGIDPEAIQFLKDNSETLAKLKDRLINIEDTPEGITDEEKLEFSNLWDGYLPSDLQDLFNDEGLTAKQKKTNNQDKIDSMIKFEDLTPTIDREFHGALLDTQILTEVLIKSEGIKNVIKNELSLVDNNFDVDKNTDSPVALTDTNLPPFQFIKTDTTDKGNGGLSTYKEYVDAADSGSTLILSNNNSAFDFRTAYKYGKENDVNILMGTTITLVGMDGEPDSDLKIVAKDENGFKNLNNLVSKAYENQLPASTKKNEKVGFPRVDIATIKEHSSGLMAFSGGENGILNQLAEKKSDQLPNYMVAFKNTFKDGFFVEIGETSPTNITTAKQASVNTTLLNAASRPDVDVPSVLSHTAYFTNKHEHSSYRSLQGIKEKRNPSDFRYSTEGSEQSYIYNKSDFDSLKVPNEVITNGSVVSAVNCELQPAKKLMPSIDIPDGMTKSEFFYDEAKTGIITHLKELYPDDWQDKWDNQYEERTRTEVDIISNIDAKEGTDFIGYYFIVAEYVNWAKENDVLVGPGRGSGAGSILAWGMNITDVDPVKYDLLFERFLNPERVSMPDFDVDFSDRTAVYDHIVDLYGKDYVAYISTLLRLTAKAVIGFVAKQEGLPFDKEKEIANLIPDKPGITISDALGEATDDPKTDLRLLIEQNPKAKRIIDMAQVLEGKVKAIGTHASGVIIYPEPLRDVCGFNTALDGSTSIQVPGEDAEEEYGLVKYDDLGLKSLISINSITESMQSTHPDVVLDLTPEMALNDNESYKILADGNTSAIFQVESEGMQKLLKDLNPKQFSTIVDVLALYRPGPMDAEVEPGKSMLDIYVEVEQGKRDVAYPHPKLEELLKSTNGVFIYQEQVMNAARILAGYSLGEADLLRRAMGKKKISEMDKHRTIFISRALEINSDKPPSIIKNVDSYQKTISSVLNKDIEEIDFKSKDLMSDVRHASVQWSQGQGMSPHEQNALLDELKEYHKYSSIFDQLEKFAGYGFNKSHSVAYAMVTMQMTYLKTHFIEDFYSGLLKTDADFPEKCGEYISDAIRNDVPVLPPSINASTSETFVNPNKEVQIGFNNVKIIKLDAAEKIEKERNKNGEFKSIFDFVSRVKLRKNQYEALAFAGALDEISPYHSNPDYEDEDRTSTAALAVASMAGAKTGKELDPANFDAPFSSSSELRVLENEYLGYPITQSIDNIEVVQDFRKDMESTNKPISDISNIKLVADLPKSNPKMTAVGSISGPKSAKQPMMNKKGTWVMFELSDDTGTTFAMMDKEMLDQLGSYKPETGDILAVNGSMSKDGGTFFVDRVKTLSNTQGIEAIAQKKEREYNSSYSKGKKDGDGKPGKK